MKMNGMMIDCSRLMERHDYYFKLLDFMAEWGMKTLLFHFSDDYGCAIRLPGFEKLAMPKALTAKEIRALVKYAAAKGIDVIPELETFGHTRFITDRPEYKRLKAGAEGDHSLGFNAIDPLSEDTHKLVKALIKSVVRLFPSKYLHIGCDEVNLKQYCERTGLAEAAVWTDYVNKVIGYAKAAGRKPLMWADHPAKDPVIAGLLRKDVTLVIWRYENRITEAINAQLVMLKKKGFRDLILAPGVAAYRYRFQPCTITFQNIDEMVALAVKHRTIGIINTVWCPWRYLQSTLYYALAYGAVAAKNGGMRDITAFKSRFAREFFGLKLTPDLESFLGMWPKMKMLNNWCSHVFKRTYDKLSVEELAELEEISVTGESLARLAGGIKPVKNRRAFDAMVLASTGVMLCATRLVWGHRKDRVAPSLKKQFNSTLKNIRAGMSAEWDRTRYPGDPRKYNPPFENDADAFILVLLKRMEPLK